MIKNKTAKKALIDADLTTSRLAEITGYSREHLSNVINGNIESIRAKKVIALAVGKKYEDIWADQSVG